MFAIIFIIAEGILQLPRHEYQSVIATGTNSRKTLTQLDRPAPSVGFTATSVPSANVSTGEVSRSIQECFLTLAVFISAGQKPIHISEHSKYRKPLVTTVILKIFRDATPLTT